MTSSTADGDSWRCCGGAGKKNLWDGGSERNEKEREKQNNLGYQNTQLL